MVKLKHEFTETHPLVRFANKMSGFYGHPVFLIGSQLTSDTPRDVDIVCIIPDKEFLLRWYPLCWGGEDTSPEDCTQCIEKFYLGIHTGIHTEEHWSWYEDMMKKSFFGMKATRIPIDFKVQSFSYAETHYKDKPQIRLDTRPY